MTRAMSRMMKAALVIVILVCVPLGLVFFRPELLLSALAKSTASSLGYEITSMQVSQLGLSSTTLSQLSLRAEDQELDLKDIVVRYSLTQLFAVQVESVEITELEVRMITAASLSNEEPITFVSIFETLDDLPINSLSLPSINIYADDDSYEAAMSLQSPPLQIEGSALLSSMEATLLSYSMQRTGSNRLQIQSSVLMHDELVFESDLELNAAADEVAVIATGLLLLPPLREQLQQLLPATTVVYNERISFNSQFNVREIFGEPTLSDIHAVIDSPNSMLHISQQSDLGASDIQLRLPIDLQGDIRNFSGDFRLQLDEIFGTGSWTQADAEYRGEGSFQGLELACTSFSDCDFQSDWQSNLLSWRFGEYFGDNLRVSAPLRFNYANDEMRLATDLVRVAIASVQDSSDPGGMKLSTSLTLDEFELRVGDLISGGFNFESQSLSLDNNIAELTNPAYSGKLQIEEDVLTGILEFDLDQRLRLGIGLQHFFLRDTGDAVLQLGAHTFSEAEPFSSLIAAKQIDGDIVAGQWEGLANISWSKQPDASWSFGGPIALKVDSLSGYYADYFFVDFSTDLFAEATTPPGIAVTNAASASIARIDIGLPLENLSWNYQFDSRTEVVQISDFTTTLLGGTLSVPAARYNPARDRQQVDVILADLNVEGLVGLAEYPNLQADGLISGYLPFIIEGNAITIEKGLVGALNPGGSIRYTPSNPVPSTNQSLRLVNQALSNYQYQTMNTEVTYDADGELLLGVQLRGSNPGMNNGQAINLNVNISDNIPSLLRRAE